MRQALAVWSRSKSDCTCIACTNGIAGTRQHFLNGPSAMVFQEHISHALHLPRHICVLRVGFLPC